MYQSGHWGALWLPLLCKHIRVKGPSQVLLLRTPAGPRPAPSLLWYCGEGCKICPPSFSPGDSVIAHGKRAIKPDGAGKVKDAGGPPCSALPVWLLWLFNLSSVKGKASLWLPLLLLCKSCCCTRRGLGASVGLSHTLPSHLFIFSCQWGPEYFVD